MRWVNYGAVLMSKKKQERVPTVNIREDIKKLVVIKCAKDDIRIIDYVSNVIKKDLLRDETIKSFLKEG